MVLIELIGEEGRDFKGGCDGDDAEKSRSWHDVIILDWVDD